MLTPPLGRWARWGAALIVVTLFALLASHTGGRPTLADPMCGNTGSPAGPFNFETYEAAQWRSTYGPLFALAGYDRLFPRLPTFTLPRLETGGRSAGSGQLTGPYIPPRLLKAIAWVESGWMQADWSVPYGEIGPVLTSSSCAYGIMQVLSGMENTTGVPNLNQAMIGGHYAFNIARGARILADKWNAAPEFRPIVGKRNPKIVENWYYAVWSYHGFAFRNHPLNPAYSPSRPAYRCDGTQPRSNYPYQELVFGCMRNPPVVDGERLWNPLKVRLPNPLDPAFALDSWRSCSISRKCAAMDLPTPSRSHKDSASTSLTKSQVIGSPKIKASPTGIELSSIHGGTSVPVALTISNPGSGVLAWLVTANEPWLKLSRQQGVSLGSDLGPESFNVKVRAKATSIPAGTHTATVKLRSHYPNETIKIKVTFNVFELPDDTLLADSGAIYVMSGGLKRLIPNRVTFEALGFGSKDVVTVPDSLPPTIPTGKPLLNVLADGNLLKGSDSAVYVMEDGVKRQVKSSAVMDACGYGWDAVYTIADARLERIPNGARLSGAPCPHLSPGSNTLVQGNSSRIYVMSRGLKRRVPNTLTLEANGYLVGNVNRIPDSALGTIPSGRRLLSVRADGNLLKGSSALYVMESGVKRRVKGGAVMEACGYDWDAVFTIDDARLARIPKGVNLTGAPCPQLSPSDGTLIQGTNSKIYVMSGGLKRRIPNTVTRQVNGYLLGNVNRIADSTMGNIPSGHRILNVLADGNLLKGSGGAVYVMEDGVKRHIKSMSVMDRCGYGWDAVYTISDSRLDAIPTGSPLRGRPCPHLSPPTGTLLQGSGSAIYVMDGGLKRHIASVRVFRSCGYLNGNINFIPDSTLAGVPDGKRLRSSSCA
jgi:hypothetical protein